MDKDHNTENQQQDEWKVYQMHCRQEFKALRDNHKVLYNKLDELQKYIQKTMHGNGKEGLVTGQARQDEKIDRNAATLKVYTGIIVAIFVFVAGRVVWDILSHVGRIP